MARMLLLTDRPQEDEWIVSRAIELAHRLGAREVSAVVTRHADAMLATGFLFGVPDGGLPPQGMSPCSLSIGWNNAAATEQLFARCRQDAAFYGLMCETVRANTSLRRTAAMLASVVGLVMISRETLLSDEGELVPLWSEVERPWLICPTDAEPWKRIVVAAGSTAHRNELTAWGEHWSRRFDVPLALIELGSPPPPSAWSAVTRWLPWSSLRQHRDAVREGLLACGLGPGDLLLVDREPAAWPFPANACDASLDDLVASMPCSMGVAPKSSITATRKLLYPYGLTHADESVLEIVAV